MQHVWKINIHGVSVLPEACFFKSGKGTKTLSCCIDFHDDLKYGLGVMDRVELFGVQKSKFKKAPAPEVRKNKIHMHDLMMKYHKDIGDRY
jgi:hypothetical protein